MSEKRKGGARLSKPESHAKKPKPAKAGGDHTPPARNTVGLKTWQKAIIIVAVVLAVLVIGFFVWYKFFWAVMPDVPTNPDLPVVSVPTRQPDTTDPNAGETPSEPPAIHSERKENFYTFLVVGRDTGGGGNTDTMMLVAYDLTNQKLSVISLPRDTMVDARHPGSNKKLNAVYNLGRYYSDKSDSRTGIDYLKEACGDMMGFTPDFYVFIRWEAFGRLVDALKGVEFNVPRNMDYDDPSQDLHIHQTAGWRNLSGDDAMQIVRWRHDNATAIGYPDGDLGRIRTQQALLKAIMKKCLQIQNVTKIGEFVQIFKDEVTTDLTLGNLAAFAERAILGGLTIDNVNFMTIPYEGVYVGKTSYVQTKPQALLDMLNEYANPYQDDLRLEDLDIMQYDKAEGRYYTTRGDGTPRN